LDTFTPVSATIGGALIGLSAVLLMLLNGRIAGISGVFGGMFSAQTGDRAWRVLFVAGLIVAPLLVTAISGEKPAFQISPSVPLIVCGGLLVGFGARLGSGCTSGHGVCGLSRLSVRSMVSVALFMATGVATVAIATAILGS